MGLRIEISLDKELREINQFFNRVKFDALTKAAKQALNKTATKSRTLSTRQIRSERNVKLKELRKRISITRAQGRSINKMEARVNFSGIPLPLILFIVGKAEPRKQNVPNRRRKSRSFRIVKGQKKAKKGLFVEKAKRGKNRYQVFRRKDSKDKTKGFVKQSAPSVAEFLRSESNTMNKIKSAALQSLSQEFSRAFNLQLSKIRL